MAIILGIESSCDETSASVCIDGKVINNEIAGQDIHEQYGGVVPELASREHQRNIVPVVNHVLTHAGINVKDLDGIAYTRGPGLLGALLIGSSFAKAMASSLDIPLIPVHHMKAHVLAHFIDDPKPTYPFICLTVSGGHTQILRVNSPTEMNILGQTQDDAVGEAFDKAAKLLGLPYPGGPMIDKLSKEGDENKFSFAESEMPDLDYSFSGIKTSILYFLRKEVRKNENFIDENLNDLAASIQKVLISMLMDKLIKAAKQENINQIAIAGGVSANSGLRERLEQEAQKKGWDIFIPDFQYCTDNAGMIAISGHLLFQEQAFGKLTDSPLPRMPF
ncbi:tRNA (adenosine(37)-N6)-threonylcarbamoyltransferase complex transferase subunit TsaD [Ekhidna lutea]|uniref:tRNA (adenosine(37)-N6)-threonylcarbamoyltransferase complex transferase subunit TsaD n=1 Tax=Ekhidna lutea TaxID=447679 RepID=UPI000B792441|nr:tRNA (adenosine(37)-N6)-threonylcarbamoyltransferase complex transferase subunit TsaD [Ekhidna lutea]